MFLAAGAHHYCAIDEEQVLRCTGHNGDGRSSLYWPGQQAAPELTSDALAALEVAQAAGQLAGESAEELEARMQAAVTRHLPNRTLDVCTGQAHTCAIEGTYDAMGNVTGTRLVCWGSNYSEALDVADVMSRLELKPERGGPKRVYCGARFVCVAQHVQVVPPATNEMPTPPLIGLYPYCTGIVQSRAEGIDHTLPSAYWPQLSNNDPSIGHFDAFAAGANHACGILRLGFRLRCFGNFPLIPASLGPSFALVGLACGGTHICGGKIDGTFACTSGSGQYLSDATWIEELIGAPTGSWGGVASITLADSIACVVGRDGQAYCGGEPGQRELRLIHPPIKLQPHRIDLLERGISFTQVSCGGTAARNATTPAPGANDPVQRFVQLGEQYCCGLTHARLVHCWGVLPPHGGVFLPREDLHSSGALRGYVPFGFFVPLNESNASVFHIRSRRRIEQSRYLRDFGLQLLLDTQPNMSAAEVTANFSQPYACYNVPQYRTQNMSDWMSIWLGGIISNASNPVDSLRSWHLTMLLVLQLAAYTDGLSCFNFTQPFPLLHCAVLVPYVNRTVELVQQPPKPFTIERLTATDMYTTRYTLSHTLQPDNYCFEKLRLTPSEQFRRGAAWHRATQRLVDGFEILFSFQIDNGALLCKTVRTLVTGVLMYEKCVRSGADGMSLLLRGGGPPTALGAGGASLGYGGLERTLAIEFDTWHNPEMGDDAFYNHVSVQTGGPTGTVGAHREHYLSSAHLDPIDYPMGLADGHAHLARIVYTPGLDIAKLGSGPSASPHHLKYWVQEGPVADPGYPYSESIGSWMRAGTGVLQVYLDAMATPLLALPIDLRHTLGLHDGRAWVGLSASTGRRFQNHYALGWQLCEGPTGCARPMTSCEAFGCNPRFPSARYEPSATEASAAPPYAELARGVAARPRRLRGTNLDNLDAVDEGSNGYQDPGSAFPDAPAETSWGDEPPAWRTPLRPLDTNDLWGASGDYRFSSSDSG